MTRVRSKRWTFTLNNYTEENELQVQALLDGQVVSYLIYGREVGESGTPHLQGYLETSTKVSFRTVKDLMPTAHLEKARGSLQSNRTYCTKEDQQPFEGGSPMQQGQRSDLVEIKTLLDSGATIEDIADQHFSKWVVYRRSFQAYIQMKSRSRKWQTKVHVYWGKTGTGKTRFVMDQVMDSDFWSPGDYKWFDGYQGQPIVIFDDYRGEYPLQLLLKLLDRYPMRVPIKGGFTEWAPRKVYITSNIHPNEWYPNSDRFSISAMFRRLHLVESVFEPLYE